MDADYSADMETNTAPTSDPFSSHEVDPDARFAGQGEQEEKERFARQLDLVAWLDKQTWSDFAQSLTAFFQKNLYLSPKQEASGSSMRTKCEAREAARAPQAEAAASNPVTEDGVYKNADGDIFKAVHNQSGSSMYAKKLAGGGDDGKGKYRWDYAAGAIKSLTADMLLTLDEAREFGTLTGTCVMCGAYLTNEESIAFGIGPVCRTRF